MKYFSIIFERNEYNITEEKLNEKSIEIKKDVINKNKNLFKGSKNNKEKEVTLLEESINKAKEKYTERQCDKARVRKAYIINTAIKVRII